MSTRQLVEQLKNNDQDFEWYPTTQEILDVVKREINATFVYGYPKVMDIGAGDGRVLKYLTGEHYRFGIEKSQILINQMPEDVVILGTDFYNCGLYDKEMDVIFCNPPYSDYEDWTTKIIKQANCKEIYLVIPQRWSESEKIKQALELRGLEIGYNVKTLGSFDFYNADRQARAVVDIVKITFRYTRGRDPFSILFEEEFKDLYDVFNESLLTKEEEKSKQLTYSGSIENLVEQYQNDLINIHESYQSIRKIPLDLFKEMGITLNSLQESLKNRMISLKRKYWEILFNVYTPLISRFTIKTREKILSNLKNSYSTVDFTVKNCYAVTSMMIRLCEKYYDSQAVDLFWELASLENIKKYKSNQRTIGNEGWRYLNRNSEECLDKFGLEYRIIITGKVGLAYDYSSKKYRLTNRYDSSYSIGAEGFINDLLIVASNLGFDTEKTIEEFKSYEWDYGKRIALTYKNHTTNKEEILCELKIYKNGNVHIFFNPKFIIALNVNVGRILGWLKSSDQAKEELDLTDEEIEQVEKFNTNVKLSKQTINLMLGYTK